MFLILTVSRKFRCAFHQARTCLNAGWTRTTGNKAGTFQATSDIASLVQAMSLEEKRADTSGY
jgi:hypothetical protein